MSLLYEHLKEIAGFLPNKSAIIDHGDRKISYQELISQVDQLILILSDELSSDKETPRVALVLKNSIEQTAIVFALSYLGAVVIPINPELTDDQIDIFLSVSQADLVITENGDDAKFNNSVKITSLDFLMARFMPVNCNVDSRGGAVSEAFLVTLSSGSTGEPKPIVLSETTKLKRAEQTWSLYGINSDDVVLNASPFFHSLGQRLTFVPLLKGATLVLLNQFTPQHWIDQVESTRVTFTICVASHLYALRDHFVSQADRLSSLQTIVSSSAAIDKELKDFLFEQIGCAFYEIYGATEVAIATNLEPRYAEQKSASVGVACQGIELVILDEQQQPLPVREVGEIGCRSPLIFSGYLNQPEQTEAAFHQGYFLTGDLGYLDEENFLYFVSRKKDVIISGGSNLYPIDIEAVILESTAIAECAVIGVNDSYLGEAVVAVCVWQQGAEQEEWKLRQWVNSRLPPFQRPLKYFFIEQLPLTSTGKLNKHALREEYNRLGLDLSKMIRALHHTL